VVLAALIVTSIVVVAIQRSRLGRMLQGMSSSTTGVTAMGLSVNVSKVIVFCISAFFAGVAGVLLGVSRGFAVGGDPFYISFNSLVLLAMLALAPFAEPWYALVPAVAAVLPGYLTGANTTLWLNAGFGVAAVLVAVKGGHPTMPTRLRDVLDRIGGRRESTPIVDTSSPVAAVDHGALEPGGEGIEVRNLSVRFGGLRALDEVSFAAPLGRITGLIGPNGAGKTTAFNACSGLNRRYTGDVLLHGRNVNGLSPSARARRGLGRTFQRMELGDTLSVSENVLLGREASQAGASPTAQLLARPNEKHEAIHSAWAAMELCGITSLADTQVGALSTGQRRLVELARCIAGPFDVLLLDEPSSGLDRDETARFGELLQRVVAERGVGILLVEHDMELVMRVCQHIYVLDFGELIFEGTPSAVASSETVQAAYLGSSADGELVGHAVEQEVAPA
jgi:ABC-type branched-subunit amino acid transport system ATPase component